MPRKLFLSANYSTEPPSSNQFRLASQSAQVNHRLLDWLRGKDLNLRPSGYEPDELPDCSTPRLRLLPLKHPVSTNKAMCLISEDRNYGTPISFLQLTRSQNHLIPPKITRLSAHFLSNPRPSFKHIMSRGRFKQGSANSPKKYWNLKQNSISRLLPCGASPHRATHAAESFRHWFSVIHCGTQRTWESCTR